MRIGVFHATLPEPARKPGGVEVFAHRLSNALAGRGHEVTVYSFAQRAPSDAAYRLQPIGGPRLGGRLARLTRGSLALNGVDWSGLDVLHLHGDDWLFVDRPLPTVRSIHGSALWEARTATSLRRRVAESAIYPLELLASRLADGTYTSAASMPSAYRLDGRLQLAAGPPDPALAGEPRAANPVLLFVGTWEGRKRGRLVHELFLREVRPLLPDAELWMVSDRCDAAPGVRWIAHPSDHELGVLYRQAWAMCLPSTYEGFGLPYLEAMQHGTPVVASPNPGALWVTDGGRAGLIARDAELGTAIAGLLSDGAQRQALREAGLERAQAFTWEQTCNEHEHAYEQAISAYEGGSGRLRQARHARRWRGPRTDTLAPVGRIRTSIEGRVVRGPLGRLARQAAAAHPLIVGGPRKRVRVGEGVVLSDVILNVASGTITIGDSAFFGHGVALLTGTHEVEHRGEVRQARVPQGGRDIVIGPGAWIASNATVLGPCTIGDHAVVAAGAVVCDDVASWTLVGGVPARVLRQLDDAGR